MTVPPVAENLLDLMRSDFSHRKIGEFDEFLVKNPMTHIFFCHGHGDGSPAAEHDRQAVQGGVDRFRYGPGVPSGV